MRRCNMTEKEQIQFLTEQNNQLKDMIRLKDEFFEREHQLNLEDKKKLACLKDLEEQQDEFMYDLAMLYFIITRCEIKLINSAFDRWSWYCIEDEIITPKFLESRNEEPFLTNIQDPNERSYSLRKEYFNLEFIVNKINKKGLQHIIEKKAMDIENSLRLQHFGNRVEIYNKFLKERYQAKIREEIKEKQTKKRKRGIMTKEITQEDIIKNYREVNAEQDYKIRILEAENQRLKNELDKQIKDNRKLVKALKEYGESDNWDLLLFEKENVKYGWRLARQVLKEIEE